MRAAATMIHMLSLQTSQRDSRATTSTVLYRLCSASEIPDRIFLGALNKSIDNYYGLALHAYVTYRQLSAVLRSAEDPNFGG